MLLLWFSNVLSVTDIVTATSLLAAAVAAPLIWVMKVERKLTALCTELKQIKGSIKELREFHEEHVTLCTNKK